MFKNEVTKKRKGEAAMAVEAPKGLFVIANETAATEEEGEQERVVPGWESWEF